MIAPENAASPSNSGLDAIQPYSMHVSVNQFACPATAHQRQQVSARYLELTRKKLELTRLPRELPTDAPQWSHGTPKAVLEPLLDYWFANPRKYLSSLTWLIIRQAGTV